MNASCASTKDECTVVAAASQDYLCLAGWEASRLRCQSWRKAVCQHQQHSRASSNDERRRHERRHPHLPPSG